MIGKAVIVTLVVLLLAPETLAGDAPWTSKLVPVYSSVRAEWQPDVIASLDYINSVLPKRAPHFVYHAMPEASCESLKKRRGITLCESERLILRTSMAEAHGHRRRRVVRVRSSVELESPQILFCHELSHAVTGIGGHGAWTTITPCPFDVKAARQVYRRHGKR